MITFTAPEDYGIYTFEKWKITTSAGTNEVNSTSVNVDPQYHSWISANYRLNVPDMEVPDTLYVTWNQGSVTFDVKNNNVCDHLPMEWFSIAESEWFSIDEHMERGTEEGEVKVNITNNTGEEERSGSFTVYAFDAANPEQEVVIVQGLNPVGVQEFKDDYGLNIYPNPAGNEIYVEMPSRFYGESGTITLLNMDGREIVSMEISYISYDVKRVSLELLSAGMYVMEVNVKGESIYRKFVKRE